MNIIKSYSRRILLWTLLIMLFLALLLEVAGYLIWQWLDTNIPFAVLNDAAARSPKLSSGLDQVESVIRTYGVYIIPTMFLIFFVFALILWLILKASFLRRLRGSGIAGTLEKVRTAEKGAKEPQRQGLIPLEKDAHLEAGQRYYLHLLSLLQREGRLVDFFEEDLSRYGDAQIGAAVRSIQENCKKAINKHLMPKAVIDKAEGEDITLEPNFDPSAVKLTGNVTDEPPFRGILRHRGWRAGKLELPTLSGARDSRIISPAEVEIP